MQNIHKDVRKHHKSLTSIIVTYLVPVDPLCVVLHWHHQNRRNEHRHYIVGTWSVDQRELRLSSLNQWGTGTGQAGQQPRHPKFFVKKLHRFARLLLQQMFLGKGNKLLPYWLIRFVLFVLFIDQLFLCIEGMSVICVFIIFLSVFKIISWTSYNFSFLPFRGVVSTTTKKARIPLVNCHVLLERISGLVNFSTVVTGIVYIFEVLGLNRV